PDDRGPVWHHRREPAHEDRGKFRDIVALRAFFDMLEIIQSQANDFSRPADRQGVSNRGQRLVRARRRALGDRGELLEIAIGLGQRFAEIVRHFWVNRLQIDNLIALDDAETPAAVAFERNDFHAASFDGKSLRAATIKVPREGLKRISKRNAARHPGHKPKLSRSRARAAKVAGKSKPLTMASRKPPGGMAWLSGARSS